MALEKGVSNWLNSYPLREYGFDLNKQQFGMVLVYDTVGH